MKIFDNLRGRAAIQGTADRFGQSPEDVRREIQEAIDDDIFKMALSMSDSYGVTFEIKFENGGYRKEPPSIDMPPILADFEHLKEDHAALLKENLRDNMSDLEMVLTMLAEASTADIAKSERPQGFEENQKVARRGGNVAGVARKALEAETGKPVATSQNAESFRRLVTDILTDATRLPDRPKKKEG